MSQKAEFLKQIAENPKNKTLYLIFADWLEEDGEEKIADAIRGAAHWRELAVRFYRALKQFGGSHLIDALELKKMMKMQRSVCKEEDRLERIGVILQNIINRGFPGERADEIEKTAFAVYDAVAKHQRQAVHLLAIFPDEANFGQGVHPFWKSKSKKGKRKAFRREKRIG